jgi:hypothetical protein
MSLEYKVGDKTYCLSYEELRQSYLGLCQVNDAEFMRRLPEAIHLACVICFLKEIPSYVCLRDDGIVHQLAHLLHIPENTVPELKEIRELFEMQLKLV